MDDCIFCKIIKKEVPAEIVYEDNKAIVFLDINPVNDGHLLIIPKEHYPYMTDTPDDLLSELFILAKKLMPKLKEVMNAQFVVVSVVGTDVPHFHIHLIPRFQNDGLKASWPTKKYNHEQHMKEVGEKIRNNI
jgi:histidine triad (HIT) family protein